MNRMMRWIKGTLQRHLHGMITCEEFEQFILNYLEDELAPPQRRVFERHLKLCRECRDYLATYKRSLDVGAAVLNSESGTLPVDVPEDLISAIMDARRQ